MRTAGACPESFTRPAELALSRRLDEGDWFGALSGRVNDYTPTVCTKNGPVYREGNRANYCTLS